MGREGKVRTTVGDPTRGENTLAHPAHTPSLVSCRSHATREARRRLYFIPIGIRYQGIWHHGFCTLFYNF